MKFNCHTVGLTCGLFLLLCGTSSAQETHRKNEINFLDRSFSQALTSAKGQHKVVFVDAYAVWCVPCKDLKLKTFKNSQVASYFNNNFINISIDVEKGEGEKFAELFDVSSYPTLLFIDENGNLIKKAEGFIDVTSILTLAKNIK